MFLGEYQHSADEKGRVVLPRKFGDGLSDGCVITKGQDRCLYVFAMDRWDEELEKMKRLPRSDRRARSFSRSFFAGAADVQLDKQGRIQVPPVLREFAGLDRDVTVVGVADRIEIWSTERWQEVVSDADVAYADTEFSEYGI